MATDSEQSDNRARGLSTPLVLSLLGFLAAAALGIPLTLQVAAPPRDPVEWAHGPVPVFDDAGFAPPAGCGEGRLIISACEKTGRPYAIYLPSDYFPALPGRHNKARSYPLVVWATTQPINRETANELARTWGPGADRDRYMVLMWQPPDLEDWYRDSDDLHTLIADARHWWLVTDLPVMPIAEPANIPPILDSQAAWPPLRIEYSIDACKNKLSTLHLVPVVAARLGRIDKYEWDCRELGWGQPTRAFSPSVVMQKSGTFTVGLTITDQAGQTFTCTRKLVVPPANESSPPSCLPE